MVDESAFAKHIGSYSLQFFKPYEFLVMGSRHADPNSPAFGLNNKPPESLWENMRATAKIMDHFRLLIGSPVRIVNAYRSPRYNRSIGGAKASQHLKFNALDFVVDGNSRPTDWADLLGSMRDDQNLFKGGIGRYATFVHIDTRGSNANW